MKIFVYWSSLFFLMLITGVFWGTWFTLTRSIEMFSPDEFTHIGKVIIANVALAIRIIMPSGIVLTIWSLWLCIQKQSTGYYTGVLSLVLLIATLLITVLILVPDGTLPYPGGWNRIELVVEDINAEVDNLKKQGASFPQ